MAGRHLGRPLRLRRVWSPTPALLEQGAQVKAIFLMGAGADAILKFGDALPDVPIVRLGDAGMGEQMAEYVAHAVLRYFRRFDDYERQARQGIWKPLEPRKGRIHGRRAGPRQAGRAGAAGAAPARLPGARLEPHAEGLAGRGLLRRHGSARRFLAGTRVLVCMLPLTPETTHLLDRARLSKLPRAPTWSTSRAAPRWPSRTCWP
jgi:glyoxylate/hydroxypyruvate reductase A